MSDRFDDSTVSGLDDTEIPEPRKRAQPTFTPADELDAAPPTVVSELELGDRTLVDRGVTHPIEELEEELAPADFVRRPLDLVEATPTDVARAPIPAQRGLAESVPLRLRVPERTPAPQRTPPPAAEVKPKRPTRPPPAEKPKEAWTSKHSMLIVGSAFFGIAFFILGIAVHLSREDADPVLLEGVQHNIPVEKNELSARTETHSGEIAQEKLSPETGAPEKAAGETQESYLARVRKAHGHRPPPVRSRLAAPELPPLPAREVIKRDYPISEAVPNPAPLLIVETTPPGVSVEVDGVACGASPLMLPLAAEVEKAEIKLSAAGYLERKLTARRGEGGRFVVKATLEKDPRYADGPLFKPTKFKQGAD